MGGPVLKVFYIEHLHHLKGPFHPLLLVNFQLEGTIKKFIQHSRAEYRKFVYLSDVLWIKGKIKNKYIDEDGEYCVDIETSALNQRGVEVMPGDATIILPSREKNLWPLDRRL
jgi:hypothetical protein